MSAVQRSLAWARENGWFAAVTEKWNPHVRIRQDLFGIADLLLVRPETSEIVLVQVKGESGGADNLTAARRKIDEANVTRPWLLAGGSIELWKWRKTGARGKRKLWNVRVDSAAASEFTDDMQGIAVKWLKGPGTGDDE